MTDTLGLLLAVAVQKADIQDRDGADEVVSKGMAKYPGIQKLFVDRGYAGRCERNLRDKHDIEVEVALRPSDRGTGQWRGPDLPLFEVPRGFVPLPKRWVVERTHAWDDRPRRLAKDHDQRLDVAEAWLWLTQARILGRRLSWQYTEGEFRDAANL